MIVLENVSKIFKTAKNKQLNAVNNVSLKINKGEIYGIIGFSGAGKSTLVRCINLLERPTSGKVYVDGKDIYSLNDDNLAIFRRRQVGIIYQFYNLIPILNVEENITLPCDLDGNKVDEKRLNELLGAVLDQDRKEAD